jgi:N-dimethylarginine dimethylaminohydrolase
MMENFGTCDEYSKLRRVILCPPTYFEIKTPINATQAKWFNMGRGPDPVKSLDQYETVKNALLNEEVEVWEISPSKNYTYQIFTRDVGVISHQGAFMGQFKFDPRKGELKPFSNMLNRNNVPVYHRFKDGAVFEGGDFIFINRNEAFVGVGDRTNEEGLRALNNRLPSMTLYPVHLPEGFLHLDVVLNLISPNIALAYLPAVSDESRSFLESKRFEIIDVYEEEQETMATNVLAIGDNKILSASCNKITNEKIRNKGFDVIEFDLSEIVKGGGGIRCMTLPVLRG